MAIEGISRRKTLTAGAAVGVGIPLLAACGASGGTGTSAPGAKAGEKLGASSDVPVGGGTIYADQKIVVTQPTQGDFKGFSAICTHQGCVVANVENGTINCACHGSKFSIEDGSVEQGPATSPLGAVGVDVKGGQVTTTT